MQLRILWACIKWDDMDVRPVTTDGKHQVTSDSAICTTEILHHKNVGRFLEKTQYFQRKVTIPLDVPKLVKRDSTPIRSGLRKRKRETSPVQTEPQVKKRVYLIKAFSRQDFFFLIVEFDISFFYSLSQGRGAEKNAWFFRFFCNF